MHRGSRVASSVVAAAVLATAALAGCASAHRRPEGAVPARDRLEKLKTLAGTWKSAPGSPMEGTLSYRVVGGGQTVEETIFPGTPHEMVTMYHLDGDDLVMTHYCALGNQPHMRAVPSADEAEIRFEFVSLSNGDWRKDMHMHDGELSFTPDGHVHARWRSFEDGKPGQFEARMDLVRAQ